MKWLMKGPLKMPKVFVFGRFILFFWSSENGEPVHVHVSVKTPSKNSAKFWLLRNGGCRLANNASFLSARELKSVERFITLNYDELVEAWKSHFDMNDVTYID